MKLWNADGEPLVVMEGHAGRISGVEILEDHRILSWSDDKTLRLWNTNMKLIEVHAIASDAMNIKEFTRTTVIGYTNNHLWIYDLCDGNADV